MGSSAATHPPSTALQSQRVRQGDYLTDGDALYRVAGVILGSRGVRMVELEDCRTLELYAYDGPGLAAHGLRPVTVDPAD
jgi:hypothetical protein